MGNAFSKSFIRNVIFMCRALEDRNHQRARSMLECFTQIKDIDMEAAGAYIVLGLNTSQIDGYSGSKILKSLTAA